MRSRRLLRLAVAVLVSAAPDAGAFVPSSSHALARWAEQLKGVRTLRVKQRTTFLDLSLPGSSAAAEEEIRVRRGGYFRKTGVFPRGTVEWILTPARAVRVVAGKSEVLPPADLLGPVGTMYSLGEARGLAILLRQAGIDLEQSRWVLEEGIPQLQIGGAAANRISFRKDLWTPAAASWGTRRYRIEVVIGTRFPIPYPETIEVSQGGKPMERTEVLSVELNPAFSDDLFDLRKPAGEPKTPR